MARQKQLIVLILCISMVLAAGCAGWGEDGPTNPETETDGDADAEANATATAEADASTSGTENENGDGSGTESESEDGNSDDGHDEPTDTESSESSSDGGDAAAESESEADANAEADVAESESDVDTTTNTNPSADSSVNANPSSESNAEGGSAEVNVNIENRDSTDVTAESESASESESGSESTSESESGSESESDAGEGSSITIQLIDAETAEAIPDGTVTLHPNRTGHSWGPKTTNEDGIVVFEDLGPFPSFDDDGPERLEVGSLQANAAGYEEIQQSLSWHPSDGPLDLTVKLESEEPDVERSVLTVNVVGVSAADYPEIPSVTVERDEETVAKERVDSNDQVQFSLEDGHEYTVSADGVQEERTVVVEGDTEITLSDE